MISVLNMTILLIEPQYVCQMLNEWESGDKDVLVSIHQASRTLTETQRDGVGRV